MAKLKNIGSCLFKNIDSFLFKNVDSCLFKNFDSCLFKNVDSCLFKNIGRGSLKNSAKFKNQYFHFLKKKILSRRKYCQDENIVKKKILSRRKWCQLILCTSKHKLTAREIFFYFFLIYQTRRRNVIIRESLPIIKIKNVFCVKTSPPVNPICT
jgi:hypothetical protein